ncbi:hypothetical protein JTE90_001088 [Oedothorax gibbosus]|uniref:Uncharacterized protein n=1 Tax=Oedothorax gibbosus TaxID=931172 RepID=A0AAV6UKV8_9ARAC|nr:hypothetical protein JTE90_001088 [Oedothorax gibbosus]
MTLILHPIGTSQNLDEAFRVIHGDLHNDVYSVRLCNDLGPEKLHIVLQNFPAKAVGQPKTDGEYPDSWLIDIDKPLHRIVYFSRSPSPTTMESNRTEELVTPSIEPIYVWRDNSFNLHLWHCGPVEGDALPCQCREELKRMTEPDKAFLLILIHRMKTYILHLSSRLSICENDCPLDPISPTLITMKVTLH